MPLTMISVPGWPMIAQFCPGCWISEPENYFEVLPAIAVFGTTAPAPALPARDPSSTTPSAVVSRRPCLRTGLTRPAAPRRRSCR